jgi:hypothetical protein
MTGVAGNADSLESLVDGGASFTGVVDYLSKEFAPLRPIDLLKSASRAARDSLH